MAERRGAWTVGRAARAGVLGILPTQVFVVPFGVLYGALTVEAGLDLLQSMALSMLIFAGASQLATLELLRTGAPALIIVATGLAINLRFTMYSAAIAPWFRGARPKSLILPASLLVDNVFGAAVVWMRENPQADIRARLAFWIAAGGLTWMVWHVFVVVGFQLGAAVPPSLALDFAAPVAFLALTMPLLIDKPSWLAAFTAAALAVALRGLPFNSGVLVASGAGVAAGLLAERWLGRRAATGAETEVDHG